MKPAPQSADNYAATSSPVYRALWEPGAAESAELFRIDNDPVPAATQQVMDRCRQVVLAHREQNTLRGADNKHSPQVLQALGEAGYWGLLVERDYGGSGCALRHFLPFLTQMAVIDAPLAGLAAVHGCIGAVDPLQTFGSAEQKQKHLPRLATGERLSAFASTEPGAGSDLRAIGTTATRTADGFQITGQKAFITNLAPGRTIGLLCKLEDQHAVAIVDLPDAENEHFQLVPNALHPLKHTFNNGLRLTDFAVPSGAILTSPAGKDGRAIVFHGLNRGRVALCALAAGHLRVLLAGMIAWANQRHVHGQRLAEMELIQCRCAQVAALIAGCDALAKWCGSLLDAGYRGELECIIAKVFASEAVKHAAFNLALPTHGGRFFLQGHPAGDMAYDYLAPCIYEGENDLLRLALVNALVRNEPSTLAGSSATVGNPVWLAKAWTRVSEILIYEFLAARKTTRVTQNEIVEIARQIQRLTVYSVAHSLRKNCADEHLRAAADLLGRQLQAQIRRREPMGVDFRTEVKLGQQLVEQELPSLADARPFVDPLQA
jgi:alkylation response protein AidB-like acyl-CoA dehydrogenase